MTGLRRLGCGVHYVCEAVHRRRTEGLVVRLELLHHQRRHIIKVRLAGLRHGVEERANRAAEHDALRRRRALVAQKLKPRRELALNLVSLCLPIQSDVPGEVVCGLR